MSTTHQFSVGDIQCAILHEGGGSLTIDGLVGRYPDATQDEIIAALDGKTESENSLNCLYINNGEVKMIVDTGFGENGPPTMGNINAALGSIGVAPTDIDIVFITHFHGDHIIGLLTADGQPAYPNARYVTSQAEWDEWIPKWEASDQDGHKKQLEMMQSLEDMTLLNDGDEVASGVRIVAVPGHTLGQSGLIIESNGERLIHLADVLHQAFQFKHTDWHFAFDSDGALGVKTRNRILQHCADENLLTVFYHLKFPGLGYVTKVDDTFVWNPI